MTDEQRLAFAVRFAQADLPSMRPGDLLNLQADSEHFVRSGNARGEFELSGATQDGPVTPEEYQLQDWIRLQVVTLQLLRTAVSTVGAPTRHEGQADGPVASMRVTVGFHPDGRLRVAGRFGAVFLWALINVVRAPGPLRECGECGALFMRVRRQEYCSRTCTNKAGWRRWKVGNAASIARRHRKSARLKTA